MHCVQSKNSMWNLRHLVIYSMLGALMFASKVVMEVLPNVHLLGLLILVYTLVYRKYALIPIYIFVLLDGIFAGFAPWWLPYLYIWAVLWGAGMLLPKKMPESVAIPVYMTVCGLHGLLFGALYAPVQAVLFHLSWEGMLAWIAAGFPFDLIHAISNFAAAVLVLPLVRLLSRLERAL